MKAKLVTLTTLFVLILTIVIYNNSSMHVTKHMWKYKDIKGGYVDVFAFLPGDDNCHPKYHYDWPYIYRNEKKIMRVIFCIGDRMWVTNFSKDASIVEYVGK